MKGKTISLIKAKDFKGVFKHIYRKHIVNSLGLSLHSKIVPAINGFLSPASWDTRINRLFDELKPSDITDHLPSLFCETLKSNPSLVVELGTRGGDSTKALVKAASMAGAKMLSVDMDDCSKVVNKSEIQTDWQFVQANDVTFAGEFNTWCNQHDFPNLIDVLFVDTSHEYEHTADEIRSWFPLLSKNGKVIFHDTNMRVYFKRKNGGYVKGWDNQRGVIRAIEEFLGRRYDETVPFIDWCNGWLIEHSPHSSGLTIMTRVKNG